MATYSRPYQPEVLSADDVAHLRSAHYNATVLSIQDIHGDLRILRIVPDAGKITFIPGQYVSLGLGNWEPRVPAVGPEYLDELHFERMCKRAYSLSCSILDAAGALCRPGEFPYLEIYVALVRHAAKRPPALTPRLFALQAGGRLFVEPHAAGRYSLTRVMPTDDVFFFATGTGEAPHNAMIAELLATGHQGRMVSAVCVRYRRDAAYRAVHEELARRYPNYRYLLLTTREPENLDPAHDHYAGKQYLQDIVSSGRLEHEAQARLDPSSAHVFLCGSPDMIGVGRPPGDRFAPAPGSMLELLAARGFTPDRAELPGNLHFERYW